MITLPLIAFSLLFMGRLSPGPSAVPYRHNDAQRMQQMTAVPTTVVHVGTPYAVSGQTAFSKPLDLRWQSDWTRDATDKAARLIGFHAQNAPVPFLRDVPWNMDLSPSFLRGGGAALVVKVVY